MGFVAEGRRVRRCSEAGGGAPDIARIRHGVNGAAAMTGGVKPLPVIVLALLCGCGGKPPPPDAQRIVGDWVVVDFQSPGATEDRGQRRKRAVITEGTWAEQFQGDAFEDFEYTRSTRLRCRRKST